MTDDDIELIPGLVSIWEFDGDDGEILSHSIILREKEINSLKSRVEVLGLKIRIGDLTAKIMKGGGANDSEQDEKKGSWVTSNGQHIFIKDGEDKGETVKKHFDDISKKDTQKKPSYTEKEKETIELAYRTFAEITTDEEYEQFEAMVDTLRDDEDISPKSIAVLDAHLNLKFTKNNFKDWKKSNKDQKFTITGFVNKRHAEAVKKAWNDLPDNDRKLFKIFNIKSTNAKAKFNAGTFTPATSEISFIVNTNSIPEFTKKNYYEYIAHHEAGHARWHNKYTPEQKKQWKKKADEEGLHNVTSYSNSFFKDVDEHERTIKDLERRRDDYSKRGFPGMAEEVEIFLGARKKELLYIRENAYNETHSEVYGYMNRPIEGDVSIQQEVNIDKMNKGSKILNEVFGK